MKISIIVPVYNTQNYLKKCLDSIINQDTALDKVEIIIVNDGSPDKSESIIESYKKKYPKLIKYIKKENGGLSSARNVGIREAKGDYIIFIDSDDYIEPNLISTFLTQNNNYDLFVYSYNVVYENDSNKLPKKVNQESCLSPNDALPYIIEEESVRGYAWNKIFKRSIIENAKLFFDEKIKYIEDLSFAVTYLYKCKNIFFSTNTLYNYVQRDGSLVNSSFNTNKLTAFEGYENIKKIVKKNYKEYLPTIEYYIFELSYELSIRIRIGANYSQYKEEYKELRQKMKIQFKKFIFKDLKLRYKIKSIIKICFYNLLILKYGGNNGKN